MIKIFTLKNAEKVVFRTLEKGDEYKLYDYFLNLSIETKLRFGPHPFDWCTVYSICHLNNPSLLRFVVLNRHEEIISYSVLKKGYVKHELPRLKAYNFSMNYDTDYTFAPSVADFYQSKGIGSMLMEAIINEIRTQNGKKIVLWGGVRDENTKAINFYTKFGFKKLGKFEFNGLNHDMILHF